MSICKESCSLFNKDDKLPMLPPTSEESSDSEISPNDKEQIIKSFSSRSDSSSSKYVSTFLGSSLTSVSSISEISNYNHLHKDSIASATEEGIVDRSNRVHDTQIHEEYQSRNVEARHELPFETILDGITESLNNHVSKLI